MQKKRENNYLSKILKSEYCHDYDEYVCTDDKGELITPMYISDHFRTVIKRNNLKKIRFHDLRHSCASLLLANGIPLKAIQEWLGHSTFMVTADFYSHLEYNSKVQSADTIAKALASEIIN